jgi:hypothetical protein
MIAVISLLLVLTTFAVINAASEPEFERGTRVQTWKAALVLLEVDFPGRTAC